MLKTNICYVILFSTIILSILFIIFTFAILMSSHQLFLYKKCAFIDNFNSVLKFYVVLKALDTKNNEIYKISIAINIILKLWRINWRSKSM